MQADLRSWLGLGTGAAVALVAIALGNVGHLVYLMDVHPGVAGWVQAFGSIAAIAAGFAVAAQQARNIRKDAKRAQIDAILHTRRDALAIAALATAHLRIRSSNCSLINSLADTKLMLREFEGDARLMAAFDLARLRDVKMMSAFSNVSVAAASACDVVQPMINLDTTSELADVRQKMEANLRSLCAVADQNVAVLRERVAMDHLD